MDDYIKLALRTEATENTVLREPRLMHAAIGIMTETVELLLAAYNEDRVNTKEEIGDILWYLAIGCDEMCCTLDEVRQIATASPIELETNPVKLLVETAAEILDTLKRNTFYATTVDHITLGTHFANALVILDWICEDEGWDLSEIQERNIEKLRVRFPEKFTQEQAENRDLEAEHAVLSNE